MLQVRYGARVRGELPSRCSRLPTHGIKKVRGIPLTLDDIHPIDMSLSDKASINFSILLSDASIRGSIDRANFSFVLLFASGSGIAQPRVTHRNPRSKPGPSSSRAPPELFR